MARHEAYCAHNVAGVVTSSGSSTSPAAPSATARATRTLRGWKIAKLAPASGNTLIAAPTFTARPPSTVWRRSYAMNEKMMRAVTSALLCTFWREPSMSSSTMDRAMSAPRRGSTVPSASQSAPALRAFHMSMDGASGSTAKGRNSSANAGLYL